ncbi:histone PARylation factor 1 isoform X1 [Diorhabda carinulata]|uniref:histone PARylation factor 1 isoform X1 n=1 Tax=Diorhabda carinulata TaxID=1163345 RepID=UPI0025A00AE3|nr:histone PARylation factor 1 isoform X1 [Diorhabda carinulata]
MDGENKKYQLDKRTLCKYGAKCYQKNPAHLKKYKHPIKRKMVNSPDRSTKKFKTEDKVAAIKDESESEDISIQDDSDSSIYSDTNIKVNNDVSDSDSESSCSNLSSFDGNNSFKDILDKLDNASSTNTIKSDISQKNEESNREQWSIFIKEKFLVSMPDDFYQFWDLCEKLKPSNPLEAFKEVGLYLVGPYDVLAGKFLNVKKSENEYLIHWRYYRDPPELQTVLRTDDISGYHIGYFRDDPDKLPVLLVSNSPKKNGILTPMGGNIFSAVNIFLEDLKKTGNPFRKMLIGKLQSKLIEEAGKLGIDMASKTKEMIAREKKIVTRTFNKIGLCVPYDKKTQIGYRELALSNKVLEVNLTKLQNSKTQEDKQKCLSELQPVFTYTSIATDECDFGTGIELGWNIISHGIDSLNPTVERFLATNYRLLNMEAFAKIAQAHMKNRKRGLDLSVL